MNLGSNIVITSLKRLLAILPADIKKKIPLQFLLAFLNSIVDLLGLAVIIPLIITLLDRESTQSNPYLNRIFKLLPFENENHFVFALCLLTVAIIVCKNLFSIWVHLKQNQFTWSIYENVSPRVLQNLYNKGYTYFNNANSNATLNRVVNIPAVLSSFLVPSLFQFLNEGLVLLLIIISITIYKPLIILILVGSILPVFILFYKVNGKKAKAIMAKTTETQPMVNKKVHELSFGYVDIKTCDVFDDLQDDFNRNNRIIKNLKITLSVLNIIPIRIVEVCVVVTVIIITLYGVYFVQDTSEIVTLLGLFGLAAYRTIPSINKQMSALINVKGAEHSLDILEPILLNEVDVPDQTSLTFNKAFTIVNLNYKFPEAETSLFTNLNLTLNKGEVIGLVGESGSGKTTLMNMMIGFLQPDSGTIKVDDVILNKTSLNAWHRKVGYVRQDVFIIDGTFGENIALGLAHDQIDQEKLKLAIQTAQLETFCNSLPEGVNTQIGERGSKISGGQRQRIGIARAIYHGAEILFFDEATSALDENTEHEITEAIESLNKYDLTIVIIAHRKSSLKYCDVIYEVKEGGLTRQS